MSEPAVKPDQRVLVVEINVYPTTTVTERTPKVSVYAIFERDTPDADMTRLMELGSICLIHAQRRLKANGFRKDVKAEEIDSELGSTGQPEPEGDEEEDTDY